MAWMPAYIAVSNLRSMISMEEADCEHNTVNCIHEQKEEERI
jgi:hypothetical protein